MGMPSANGKVTFPAFKDFCKTIGRKYKASRGSVVGFPPQQQQQQPQKSTAASTKRPPSGARGGNKAAERKESPKTTTNVKKGRAPPQASSKATVKISPPASRSASRNNSRTLASTAPLPTSARGGGGAAGASTGGGNQLRGKGGGKQFSQTTTITTIAEASPSGSSPFNNKRGGGGGGSPAGGRTGKEPAERSMRSIPPVPWSPGGRKPQPEGYRPNTAPTMGHSSSSASSLTKHGDTGGDGNGNDGQTRGGFHRDIHRAVHGHRERPRSVGISSPVAARRRGNRQGGFESSAGKPCTTCMHREMKRMTHLELVQRHKMGHGGRVQSAKQPMGSPIRTSKRANSDWEGTPRRWLAHQGQTQSSMRRTVVRRMITPPFNYVKCESDAVLGDAQYGAYAHNKSTNHRGGGGGGWLAGKKPLGDAPKSNYIRMDRRPGDEAHECVHCQRNAQTYTEFRAAHPNDQVSYHAIGGIHVGGARLYYMGTIK